MTVWLPDWSLIVCALIGAWLLLMFVAWVLGRSAADADAQLERASRRTGDWEWPQ